jgi:broad specificity phosphatase PhoE
MSARWEETTVSPDGTHHLASGGPLYQARFAEVLTFHSPGLAPARDASGAFHIDVEGRPAYPRRFVRTFGFYEGRAAVEDASGARHVDAAGADVSSVRFAWCGNMQGGRAPARQLDGRYLHITREGLPAYPERWRYAGDFREGYAVVQDDAGLHIHIDRNGRRLGSYALLDLDVFHKGFARAKDEGGWFHLRRDGKPAYSRRFAMVEPFYNGQARCEGLDGSLVVIGEAGQVIVTLRDAQSPKTKLANALVVPPATLRWIRESPTDRPVMVLLRHSARPPIDDGKVGDNLDLTEEGVRMARELGAAIGPRLASLRSSPVKRCMQTAKQISSAAGATLQPVVDRLLGHPGAYVCDGRLSWEKTWSVLPYDKVMEGLIDGRLDMAGVADPKRAAGRLLENMVEHAPQPGVHIFVTHDSLVLPTAAHLLPRRLERPDWPWFLEAVVVWQDGDGFEVRYREHRGRSAGPSTLVKDALSLEAVAAFGKERIADVLGPDHRGRVFLAGGAFKSLITGKAPRDLDLWASSAVERTVVIETLLARGARHTPGRFGDAFLLGDTTIDVPHKERTSLEDHFARADLGLSAVGVEWDGGAIRAAIHPRAAESVRTRRTLLIKPLANWKHALSTLARARRYSAELGYPLPVEEEQAVRDVFEAQAPEMRQGMRDRLSRSGMEDLGVLAEFS